MRDDYHHRRHKRKRLTTPAIIAIVVAAVAVYAGVLLGIRAVGQRIEQPATTETVGSLEGRFADETVTMTYGGKNWSYRRNDLTNILFIGVDWAEEQTKKSNRYDGQSDFLLLMTFDKRNHKIMTLQLDRDTMTEIRIYGPLGDYTGLQTEQICLAYAYGETPKENCKNVVWAVENLLGGIPIDGYIALSMDGIVPLNDALGGVTVTLEDDFSASDPTMTAGTTLTLHGEQAEYYVRGRMSVGDGTNASRMRRQRTFIASAQELLVQGMNDDMDFIGEVFDSLEDYITTDVERGWLINKAYESRDYESADMQTPAGSHSIGSDGFTEFHVDTDSLNDLLVENYFKETL